jgi:hypothetical protein
MEHWGTARSHILDAMGHSAAARADRGGSSERGFDSRWGRPWQYTRWSTAAFPARLILAGTGPQGGERMHMYIPEVLAIVTRDEIDLEGMLAMFFERSFSSRAKGIEFASLLREAHHGPSLATPR